MREKIEGDKDKPTRFTKATHKDEGHKTLNEKVANVHQPFSKLVDEMMQAISKFFDANKSNKAMEGKDLAVLVMGALAFVAGHYYMFLKHTSEGKVDRASFLKDFTAQVNTAIDTVGESFPFKGEGHA